MGIPAFIFYFACFRKGNFLFYWLRMGKYNTPFPG